VNNAVLICSECAVEHQKLHSGLSYVMSLADAGEAYSLQKVELLKFGGNERFRQFLDSFREPNTEVSVFKGWPIRDKYASNACKYYRHKIQMLARQETPQMDCPELEEARIIMDEDIEGKLSISISIVLDWIFVADEERTVAPQQNKEGEELHESGFKEFIHERKEDLKVIKEEVKEFFGKASALGKKVVTSYSLINSIYFTLI
jgi:hypothetical protein